MPKTHIVGGGEYLTLIARKHRFITPKAILEANGELWQRRDPNVLNPGDVLVIPDVRVKTVSRATERAHVFQLVQPEDWLRVVLKDHDDQPLDDQGFTLRVQSALDAPAGSGLEIAGQMSGGLVQARLPPGALRAHLTLEKMPWFSWDLLIGKLDPTHEPADEGKPRDPDEDAKVHVKGIQARLNNLGFYCGNVDGVIGPRSRVAIERFQREKMGRDEPDGKLDDDTRKRLRADHEA